MCGSYINTFVKKSIWQSFKPFICGTLLIYYWKPSSWKTTTMKVYHICISSEFLVQISQKKYYNIFLWYYSEISWFTAQKMKFSIADFFNKCDQKKLTEEIRNGKLPFFVQWFWRELQWCISPAISIECLPNQRKARKTIRGN